MAICFMVSKNPNMTFDQLQRYRLAADLIEDLREKKPLAILDAGSHQGFLKSFLPHDSIYNLDRSYFPGRNFIQGDVLTLPFPDDALDISLALDILEHIPAHSRLSFVGELLRVSDDIVIIGAPFAGREVAEAEKLALEFCVKMTGEEHEFLAQHLEEGLPDLKQVTGWAESRGLQSAVVPNGYLYHWLLMICFNFYLAQLKDPWEFIFAVNRFYFNRFYREDNREPAYRHFVVISKDRFLDSGRLAERFSPGDTPVPMPELGTVMMEVNRILDFVHQEKVSALLSEIEGLSKERDRLATELAKNAIELEATRAELDGIKSTIAYRIYRKTIGSLKSRLEKP
jgi:hypothetical protein